MGEGGSLMRRLHLADRVAVLDDDRSNPLDKNRRGSMLETCTFRGFAAIGLVVLGRHRIRHSRMLIGGRHAGMLRARRCPPGLRCLMHGCERRSMLNPHRHRGGRIAGSIQDQAEA
jgi:hypothetical protein